MGIPLSSIVFLAPAFKAGELLKSALLLCLNGIRHRGSLLNPVGTTRECRVSVLVPTYRRAGDLERCLASLAHQTCPGQ